MRQHVKTVHFDMDKFEEERGERKSGKFNNDNVVTVNKDTLHLCDLCDDKAMSRMEFETHLREVHLNICDKYQCDKCEYIADRGWTATDTNAQNFFFTVYAIGLIRLLTLPSYRRLTNQILIFAILD